MTVKEIFNYLKKEIVKFCEQDIKKQYYDKCLDDTNCAYFIIFPYAKKRTALSYILTLKDSSDKTRKKRIHGIETIGNYKGFSPGTDIVLTVDLQFGNVSKYPEGKLEDKLLIEIFNKCAGVVHQKKEKYLFFNWGGPPVSEAISFKETIPVNPRFINNEKSMHELVLKVKNMLKILIEDFDKILTDALNPQNKITHKINETKNQEKDISSKKSFLDDVL